MKKNVETTKTADAEVVKSAYGTTLEIVCANPQITKPEVLKALKTAGFDPAEHKPAIQTGISQAKKIISLLELNGWTKK